MNDLVKLLQTWEEAILLLQRLEPVREELLGKLPAIQRMRQDAELLAPAPPPAPDKPKRGHAAKPTIDRASYRSCVLELVRDNGGRMPAEDLKELASERIVEQGYCRKFLGKWFQEMLGTDLVELPGGMVGTDQDNHHESATDRAFLDGVSDVR